MNPGNTAPECTYTASGTGAHPASNTVTVNLVGGSVGGTTTVPVVYSGSTETDECIDVSDTLGGNFGTVCASQAPKTFSYSYMVGPFAACGKYEVNNTASFVTNDTKTPGSDKWKVSVDVPCAGGCTLTPGYWKTHSSNGPAPYDNTWAQIGENTTFFLSGKSYYSALWTSPQGNAYYILAHAYIAAKLNFLNGASSPAAVTTAFTTATGLFQTYTPAQIGELKGSDALRQQFVSLASTLDNYNNGLTGPGHCDE